MDVRRYALTGDRRAQDQPASISRLRTLAAFAQTMPASGAPSSSYGDDNA
ncbi:hypothetical protein [Streptomyces chryseus]|nr:hypothetical protein [Streptomyces chryseus]